MGANVNYEVTITLQTEDANEAPSADVLKAKLQELDQSYPIERVDVT